MSCRSSPRPVTQQRPWLTQSMTHRSWRAICATYRVLVATQTLCWAVASFASIYRRSTQSTAQLPVVVLTSAATLFLLFSVANYAWCRRQPSCRLVGAIVRSWLAVRLGGALALVGVSALLLMHFLSPNRLQDLHP